MVIQTFLLSAMALIGLSIAIQPGSSPGTAPGYIAFGGVIVAVFIFLMACQLTNRLVVTEQGLTWRNMMRTRTVAWADVQDVLTVTASSVGRWYSPAVKANGKLIRISSVMASRRRIESIVTDIRRARVEVVSG
jgi:PH (Pleckstrin Homology) domain-containing protein